MKLHKMKLSKLIESIEKATKKKVILQEATKKGWTIGSSETEPAIYRFSGKTYPTLVYFPKQKKLFGRDDNGPRPSKSLETTDVSINGIKKLLNSGISEPHPDENVLKTFAKMIEKSDKLKITESENNSILDKKSKE